MSYRMRPITQAKPMDESCLAINPFSGPFSLGTVLVWNGRKEKSTIGPSSCLDGRNKRSENRIPCLQSQLLLQEFYRDKRSCIYPRKITLIMLFKG